VERGPEQAHHDITHQATLGRKLLMSTAYVPQPARTAEAATRTSDQAITVTRRTIDRLLIAGGSVVCVVLVVAGGLLLWGRNFAHDYVSTELSAQQIFFPSAEALKTEGRTDLLDHAGKQVTSGSLAQSYASYIDHHLEGIAGGQTYAELGAVERAAKADVKAATEAGRAATEIAELQAKAATITGQRDSLFRGETLRGLLLSTYAWGTIGSIALIAAVVAWVAAAALLILVALGTRHIVSVRAANV
jgi:hypothetical protein